MDPSPCDHQSRTCLIYHLTQAIDTVLFATWKHQSVQSSTRVRTRDSHQTAEKASRDRRSGSFATVIIRFSSRWMDGDDLPIDRDPTATMKTGVSLSSRNLERRIPIRRRRRRVEEHHDRGPIEPRSRRDRAAIVDPSAWNLFHNHRSAVPKHLEHDRRSIVVNRAKIVAYFEALFEAKFKPIRRGFEATKPCNRNRLHDA